MKGTVEDWATESLLAARQAYQVPETGKRLKSGQKLAIAYLEGTCRSCGDGSIREGFGWRWCSTRRFLIDDAGELRKSHERRISDPSAIAGTAAAAVADWYFSHKSGSNLDAVSRRLAANDQELLRTLSVLARLMEHAGIGKGRLQRGRHSHRYCRDWNR